MADFGPLGGVKIGGFISPFDTTDSYAVIDPLYGIDGLRNVDLITDLDSIPDQRRRAGMIVGVSAVTGTDYYSLLPAGTGWTHTIADWTPFAGSSGSTTFSGLTDTVVTSPSNGDYLIYSGGNVINISEKDIYFTATTSGQTIFNGVLTTTPVNIDKTRMFVNGVKQRYGASHDYIITGGTDVVWVSNKHVIDTIDELEIIYI